LFTANFAIGSEYDFIVVNNSGTSELPSATGTYAGRNGANVYINTKTSNISLETFSYPECFNQPGLSVDKNIVEGNLMVNYDLQPGKRSRF